MISNEVVTSFSKEVVPSIEFLYVNPVILNVNASEPRSLCSFSSFISVVTTAINTTITSFKKKFNN